MTDIDRPRYQRFSWRPTITGTCGVDDGTSSDTIDLAAEIGSTFWGWEEDASHIASASSIQGKLAALVDAIVSPTSIVATYTWPDGDHNPPRTSYVLTHSAEVDLTFDSLATAAQFGYTIVNPVWSNIIASVPAFQDAGQWASRQRGGWDEGWEENPNSGIEETLDGSERIIHTWGEDLLSREFNFPAVYVADIREDAAETTSQAAAAGRNIADPNGLLQSMMAAARVPENTNQVRAFRVFTNPGVFRTCYFLKGIGAVRGLVTSRSVRRLWAVNFTMRDDG